MPSQRPSPTIENNILAALSPKSYKSLAHHLEPVSFSLGDILYKPDGPIEYVYFPHKSIVSLVNVFKNASTVEIGVVGSEGVVGTMLLSGEAVSPHRAVVQIADGGMRMKASAFKRELKQNAELNNRVQRYSQALFSQVAQTAACNSLHPISQRLARWLLLSQDRMESDTLVLTHEFLATMLSVQRSGVTLAAGKLQAAGIIEYRRGVVIILDRKELERASCECYGRVSAEFSRLLGKYAG